jgi:serine/threonine-protein kinase
LPKRSRRLAPDSVSHPTRTKVAWVVAVLAAVGIALLLVSQLERGPGVGTPSARPAAGTVIAFKTTGSFDPFSTSGGNDEHNEQTHNAADGNPQTDWTTESYEAGVMNKPGVGLWGKTFRAATAASAVIRTPDKSLKLEIYGARTLPTELTGWDRLATASGAVDGRRIALKRVTGLRYYMVWITELPPATGGSSKARISEFIVRR